jgi:plastocyanin
MEVYVRALPRCILVCMYSHADSRLYGCRVFFLSGSATPATVTTQIPSGGGSTVNIKDFAFNPNTLMVKTGTTVTWVNLDMAPHTIASDPGSPVAFSSGSLSTGASYQFTFSQPGTFAYHCSIHPKMTGTIVVQS